MSSAKPSGIVGSRGGAAANGAAARGHVTPAASGLDHRRLFEASRDGQALLDADTGRIVDVNPQLAELLGCARAELLGRALWELGPAQDVPAGQRMLRRLQREDGVRYEGLPLETRGGRLVPVEVVGSLCEIDGARVIQCSVRDITARRLLEDRARRAHDALLARVAEMAQHEAELERLNGMIGRLHACGSEDEASEVIGGMAGAVFTGRGGFLALQRGSDRRLRPVARWGPGAAAFPAFAPADCRALRRGAPHEVDASRRGPACRHFADPPGPGALCVPLAVGDAAPGLLCLQGAPDGVPRRATTRQLALMVAEALKLALSNLRLRAALSEQATLDALTGLFNRRHLDESLARELHRARRLGAPLGVALLDLDHFKRFNDEFGHAAGDALLRDLGALLRDAVRRSDIACRYGGEEFVLVLPGSSLADMRQRVEQVRERVRGHGFRHAGRRLGRITLSAGVAEAPAGGCTPAELLGAADKALYAAKLAGRDRVAEHAPGRPRPAGPGAPSTAAEG